MDTNIARTNRAFNLSAQVAYQQESLVRNLYKAAAKWFADAKARKASVRSLNHLHDLEKRHFSAADYDLLQFRQGRNLR